MNRRKFLFTAFLIGPLSRFVKVEKVETAFADVLNPAFNKITYETFENVPTMLYIQPENYERALEILRAEYNK